jgi:hypothetical protein
VDIRTFLLSDGNDNSSNVTRERAIEMSQRAEVAVYTISTNLTSSGGKGRKNLERIADSNRNWGPLPDDGWAPGRPRRCTLCTNFIRTHSLFTLASSPENT